MGYTDRPLSAIERARAAYEKMMQRQRAIAEQRRARARARRITVLMSLGAVLVMLLGIVVYNGWLPHGLRSTMGATDASGQFRSSRTGQVRTMVGGNTCQELKFSNDSGSFVSGNLVPCEPVLAKHPEPARAKESPLNSIRDAFKR
jgi:hypothetical protein